MIDLIIRRRRPKCVNVHWLWLFLWRGVRRVGTLLAGFRRNPWRIPLVASRLLNRPLKCTERTCQTNTIQRTPQKTLPYILRRFIKLSDLSCLSLSKQFDPDIKLTGWRLSIIYPIISFLNWFSSNANVQLKKSREISFPFVGRRLNWTRPTMWFPSTWCNPPCSGIPRTFYFIVSTGKYWSYRHVHI